MTQKDTSVDQNTILIVDDDRTMLLTLESMLKKQGYKVITSNNGQDACEIIANEDTIIDAVILDRLMPTMNGMQVVKWLNDQRDITKPPIIMQTIADSIKQIQEGIEVGVFYYLTKPIQEDILTTVVASAVRRAKQQQTLNIELKRHKTSFKLMDRGRFYFRTLDEAENIACFLANCFPAPSTVLTAIAELTINAIEHGLLAVSYSDKTKLIKSGKWREELDRRANAPENLNRKVELVFSRENNKSTIRITDPGQGFNWRKYLNVDPSRSMDNHGRGIARANIIFSDLQYNDAGNKVLATMDESTNSTLDW